MAIDETSDFILPDTDLKFSESSQTCKTEHIVLLSNHLQDDETQDDTRTTMTTIADKTINITGKEAKPPKAPRFIFLLKENRIKEEMLTDQRKNIQQFREICIFSKQDCAATYYDPHTNTSICYQLYKKLIKH